MNIGSVTISIVKLIKHAMFLEKNVRKKYRLTDLKEIIKRILIYTSMKNTQNLILVCLMNYKVMECL